METQQLPSGWEEGLAPAIFFGPPAHPGLLWDLTVPALLSLFWKMRIMTVISRGLLGGFLGSVTMH